MPFYSLKVENETNWEWRAILGSEEENQIKIIKAISEGNPISVNRPIRMHLINQQPDKSKRQEVPFAKDLIYWTDDITLNAFNPQGGTYALLSESLKTTMVVG